MAGTTKTTAKKATKTATKKAAAGKSVTGAAKKPAAKKPAAKKPAAKKAAVKKAPAKATSMITTTYFEVDGDQVRIDDIYTKVVEAYKNAGHRIGNVKTLDMYYNLSERRCYYVVNGKSDGSFVEF